MRTLQNNHILLLGHNWYCLCEEQSLKIYQNKKSIFISFDSIIPVLGVITPAHIQNDISIKIFTATLSTITKYHKQFKYTSVEDW